MDNTQVILGPFDVALEEPVYFKIEPNEDGKTIRLIFLKEEINGFRIHITVKKAPFYVEAE